MSISKSVRFEIMKRDQFSCSYCGQSAPHVVLEVDHVYPKSLGGSDHPDNLATACFACNRGKSARTLHTDANGAVSPVLALQETSARIAQQREALQWSVALAVEWLEYEGYAMHEDRQRSLAGFLRRMSLDRVHDAVQIAGAWWARNDSIRQGDAWRYFCGVCWGMIREDGHATPA